MYKNPLSLTLGRSKLTTWKLASWHDKLAALVHLYNIDLDNIQEVRALANRLPQIKDEYHRVSTLLGITKNEVQDQQQILSNIGNSISTANAQLSDLQVKIQNANMEINRKNEEILNFEQIQKSMKNSESYKDLSQFALENVQKYMDQR